jgi:uncharacterized membrane protein
MPWCGYWGMSGFWWIWPLLGIVLMAVMMFVCFHGFGCIPWGRRRTDDLADLRRELQSLKDDVGKLLRQPN